MLDDVDSFEQEFHEKGRQDGFKRGQINALRDAFHLGARHGFNISKDIASMRQAAINMRLNSSISTFQRSEQLENKGGKVFAGSERLEKLISEIISLAEAFPLKNDVDQNLQEMLKTLQQKFRMAQALYRSCNKDGDRSDVATKSNLSF